MSVTEEKERESQWLTVGEVARHLRVPRDTVERRIHNRNLKAANVGTWSTLVARPRAKLRETLRDCTTVFKPVESYLA